MIVEISNILLHSFYCILHYVDSEKCHCESMEVKEQIIIFFFFFLTEVHFFSVILGIFIKNNFDFMAP